VIGIPRRFAALTYGLLQSAITTAVASAVATYQMSGPTASFFASWSYAWSLAWLTMLPVVVGISPLLQRAVLRLTVTDES
jgi:hypothetical protein